MIHCRDLQRHMYWNLILVLVTINTTARSQEAPTASPSRVQGLFLHSAKDCAGRRMAVCEKPCRQWANGQPDFQFSYDHCLQTCPEQVYCLNGSGMKE